MESDILVKKVIQVCYEVHNELGCGYSEKVYEKALLIALGDAGFAAEAQMPFRVFFREKLVGEFFADVVVEGELIIELKAVSSIEGAHKSQLLNYLKAANRESGLLVNFGSLKLGVNRLYNQSFA